MNHSLPSLRPAVFLAIILAAMLSPLHAQTLHVCIKNSSSIQRHEIVEIDARQITARMGR